MIGLLLGGLIFAGAGIAAAIENADMKSSPYTHLDDGTPVYLDRKCNEWVNGEKMIATYDYTNKKLVYAGQRSGKVYIDPEANQRRRMDEMSEKYKREAIEAGRLAYKKYDHRVKRFLTCEISTGKYIAALRGNKYGQGYRKFYVKPDFDFYNCHCKADDDEGIEITREEFNKLNIVGGSHMTWGDR